MARTAKEVTHREWLGVTTDESVWTKNRRAVQRGLLTADASSVDGGGVGSEVRLFSPPKGERDIKNANHTATASMPTFCYNPRYEHTRCILEYVIDFVELEGL
jgi:hypothetical protein